MGYLPQGHFLSVNVLDKTTYQGPFAVDQMSYKAVVQLLAEGHVWPTWQ